MSRLRRWRPGRRRLAGEARNDAQAERWRGERERMREVRQRMAGAFG